MARSWRMCGSEPSLRGTLRWRAPRSARSGTAEERDHGKREQIYIRMSTSLSPSAAATTVGILAVRQKSYGTGSSPSIFHASLFLPSLSPDGGGRGVASPGAQTLPFPRTEHTLEEKTPVRVRLRSVRLSRSISEKWIDMHTAWSLERGRADQPTDRPGS